MLRKRHILAIFALVVSIITIPSVFAGTSDEGSFEFPNGGIVSYAYENGDVTDMLYDEESKSLIIKVNAFGDGTLVIAISRDVLDAKIGSQDAEFFVLINGEQVDFSEERNSSSRSIGLVMLGTDTEVEIIGTQVVTSISTFFENTGESALYLYVEPIPSWADYAGNAVYEATKAWEDANPDMEFFLVDRPEDSNVLIQWVKEFGVEHVGFALGSDFIEVGLGDSECLDQWFPYSSDYVAYILAHEIGHILGHEHVDDPDDLMYPVAQNLEYGIEEGNYILASNYYQFVGTCSVKDVSNYNFEVQTSDPTYGFDVYFVPSIKEFDNYDEGKSFEHYADQNCFAENVLKFSNTCEGVEAGSGLLIIMPEQSIDPLIDISVRMQEVPFKQEMILPKSQESPVTYEPAYFGPLLGDYDVFESKQFSFSIEYPSDWFVDDEVISNEFGDSIVGFTPDGDYSNSIYVTFSPNSDEFAGLSGDSYLQLLEDDARGWCTIADFEYDGFTCDSFSAMNTKKISISGMDGYQIEYTFRKQTQDGDFLQTIARQVDIPIGKNYFQIVTESEKENWQNFKPAFLNAINSFQTTLIQPKDPVPTRPSIIPTEKPVVQSDIPDFVDPKIGAQYYLDRYYDDPAYKSWFDTYYSDYTIEDAVEMAITDAFSETKIVELESSVDTKQDSSVCGEGTVWKDGKCVVESSGGGGGCLIATATFGSELSLQVQQLRELRDNTLLQTNSGSAFMTGFNQFYYSFSPTIADWERQNPVFKEVVKLAITPMISLLSLLNYVNMDSEAEVLGYGISLILLNVGMYFVAPVGIVVLVRRKF